MTGIEIAAVAAAVTTLRHLKDLLTDLGDEVPQEVRDHVAALSMDLLGAHQQAIELTDRCRKLEDDLRRVEAWEAEKARYILTSLGGKTFVYALRPEEAENGEPSHWLCQRCFEDRKKSVLQHGDLRRGSREWQCPRCGGSIPVRGAFTPDSPTP